MIQGLVIFAFPTLQILYWHIGPRYLAASLGTVFVSVTGELFWIGNAAINPLIYLAMNKYVLYTLEMNVSTMGIVPIPCFTEHCVTE